MAVPAFKDALFATIGRTSRDSAAHSAICGTRPTTPAFRQGIWRSGRYYREELKAASGAPTPIERSTD